MAWSLQSQQDMIRSRRVRSVVVCSVVIAGCSSEPLVDDVFSEAEWEYLQTFRLDRLTPIQCPHTTVRCEKLARFGQQLFFEPGYSGAVTVPGVGAIGEVGKVACTTCHDPKRYFIDSRPDNAQSLGTGWTKRNVPGLVDAAYLQTFTWHGQHDTIDDVFGLAITSAAALNSDAVRVKNTIASSYRPAYVEVFGPLGTHAEVFNNVAYAIGSYERKLVSEPSPFDRYLAGDTAAIDEPAKRGAQLFIGKALCSECHDGPLFTDQQFYVTGVEQRGAHAPPVDLGRFSRSMAADDTGKFRTAPLRHVAETAPYMHTGGIATLGDVIEFYRWGGDVTGFAGTKDERLIPLEITDDEARDLEAFLTTLTGPPVPSTWTTRPAEVP